MTDESMSYLEALKEIKRLKEALEQQPCEDAISRKDMLAVFSQSHSLTQAWDGFEKLSPVTPKEKTCEDCISRQAVLDIVNNPLNIRLDAIIKALPPVTPKEKTGKWIEIKNSRGTTIALRCSCCGNSPKHGISSDFCPNCGCQMINRKE